MIQAAKALLLLTVAIPLSAQTLAHKNWAGSGLSVETWYHHAIVYQVDPLSFQDSDGDGFGDLRGITLRLDYLQSLAPDALLLSPLQVEPGLDGAAVFDTAYGSEDDFEQLISESSRRKIRILVDLPLDSPNPLALARFWLTHGVAGLRLVRPAITSVVEPEQLQSQLRRLLASYPGNRILIDDPHVSDPAPNGNPDIPVERTLNTASALTLPLLEPLVASPAPQSFGRHRRSLPDPAPRFAGTEILLSSDSNILPRSWNRLTANPFDRDRTARLLATLLFTTRAGALLLFGQEIGMASLRTPGSPAGEPTPMQWGAFPLEPVPDPLPPSAASPPPVAPGVFLPYTPAPARPAAPAVLAQGFSTAVPWLPYGPNALSNNVALEDPDLDSLLNFYRTLSALHHGIPALRTGSSELLPTGTPGLLAFLRRPAPGTGSPVVVLLNLTAQSIAASLGSVLNRLGLHATVLRTLARSTGNSHELAAPVPVDSIPLPPLSSFLGELQLRPGLETYPQPHTHRRTRNF